MRTIRRKLRNTKHYTKHLLGQHYPELHSKYFIKNVYWLAKLNAALKKTDEIELTTIVCPVRHSTDWRHIAIL